MQLKEVFTKEQSRKEMVDYRTIYLIPEGTFYRAYEWSAWLCHRYVSQFKPTHRLLKTQQPLISAAQQNFADKQNLQFNIVQYCSALCVQYCNNVEKQFAYLCEKMVEVEDQLKKWKAYYQKDNINQ